MVFVETPNEVICPHCNKKFLYNRINGLAQVEVAQDIESRKRVYCRLALNDIERLYRDGVPPYAYIRKIIMDNFNDLARDIHAMLGFGEEVE
jgi:hypothetical protein